MAKGWRPLGTDQPFVPFMKSFDATFMIDHGSSRRVHWQRYNGKVHMSCECGADGCEHVRMMLRELRQIVADAK
jgi:hypothetical protein